MIEKRQGHDRRGDPRQARAGRITWRKVGTPVTLSGWLSDASRSGLSFVASTRTGLKQGDRLEWLGADSVRRHYSVTRVAPYDEHLSLIACRQAASAPDQPFRPLLEVRP
jgi:hypothetical protein